MKDYYKILGVDGNATQDEIKKAYRKKSKQYHPDVNLDPQAEDKFKEVAEAYDTLGNQTKKQNYDHQRKAGSRKTSFEDWVNDFGKNDFGRGRGGFNRATRVPDEKYLNVEESVEMDLVDAINGTPISVNYKRWTVTSELLRKEVDKSLNIHISLKQKHIQVLNEDGKYFIKIKLDKFGHEDIFKRTNIWGEPEGILLCGDYLLKIELNVPDNVDIEDNNIIQYVDIPLYKTLFKGEKIRVSTILDKTYEAEISSPKKINDLKFNIKKGGILGKPGNRMGNYIIKFNVIPPDLSKLKKAEVDTLKQYLIEDLE